MHTHFLQYFEDEISKLKSEGLYKAERILTTPQGAHIGTQAHKDLLNFCSNNYLGLSSHPEVIAAAKEGLDLYGYGLSSVRFICGTQDVHKELEKKIAAFVGMQDCILYSSCFDANTGLFETLLSEKDAIISDQLNHASIIDGIRLCKAERHRYENNNLNQLEETLKATQHCRFRLIATDGVFSMDGSLANLKGISSLAERYGASLMVDDSHAVGFMGSNGRGTHEAANVMDKVDIITGTLGKALGGASGGYTAGKGPIIDYLRQRSRPYLFSNTLCPIIAHASLKALLLAEKSTKLRSRLFANATLFRSEMEKAGFTLLGKGHPIVPILLGDATRTQEFAAKMLENGIYVIGFSYPVVPKGQARIRVQLSAAHSEGDVLRAVEAFQRVGKVCAHL